MEKYLEIRSIKLSMTFWNLPSNMFKIQEVLMKNKRIISQVSTSTTSSKRRKPMLSYLKIDKIKLKS